MSAEQLIFLQGAIATLAWVCGLFFFRFWKQSHDPLFGFFGAAFWLFAASWVLLALSNPTEESRPYIYAVRLVAFVLIITAMVVKNRESSG